MTGNEFCTIQNLLTPEKKKIFLRKFSTCLNKTLKMFEIILERDLVVHFLDAMMNLAPTGFYAFLESNTWMKVVWIFLQFEFQISCKRLLFLL